MGHTAAKRRAMSVCGEEDEIKAALSEWHERYVAKSLRNFNLTAICTVSAHVAEVVLTPEATVIATAI